MNRVLGILKEEPKLLYFYEYIKQDEDRVVKDGWKNKKDELLDQYRIGETFSSEEADKNPEFYKFVCTFRQAFVGDMQEKINMASGSDMMLRYCESKNNLNTRTVFKNVYQTIYIEKPSLIKRIWTYFRKGKEDDFLEKELTKSKSIATSDELKDLTDYLNYIHDKS